MVDGVDCPFEQTRTFQRRKIRPATVFGIDDLECCLVVELSKIHLDEHPVFRPSLLIDEIDGGEAGRSCNDLEPRCIARQDACDHGNLLTNRYNRGYQLRQIASGETRNVAGVAIPYLAIGRIGIERTRSSEKLPLNAALLLIVPPVI